MGTSNDEYARFLAYGNQLVEVHLQLRDLLDDLREGVVPEKDFAAHCLMFCAAVTRHHTGEDREVFPVLAQRHPELRSFLDSLVRDHEVIAGILDRIRSHAGKGPAGENPAREGRAREGGTGERGAQEDLDGLAAVLETHFLGEEKRLVGVLNALHTSVGLTPLTDAVGS